MAGKAKEEGIVNLERLSNQLNQISEPDKKAASEAKQRWDSVAKPLGSLGLLEDALIRIAALTGSADIDLSVRRLYLMCADNGVVAQNVTQTGSEVTARMADSFAAGKSSACRMAKVANCQVEAVDLGILNYPGNPGVRNCRIANGTADITQKPAMTKAELYRCIETGIGLVKCAKEDRVKLLVTGEMGIGNTTTSSAVASVLLGCDPLLVTGRGAGLSDSGLSRKLEAIKKAIKLHHPDPEDPLSVLSMLGGFDIAGMVGLYLPDGSADGLCQRFREGSWTHQPDRRKADSGTEGGGCRRSDLYRGVRCRYRQGAAGSRRGGARHCQHLYLWHAKGA